MAPRRPAVRQGIDGMRVGGFATLALAAWRLIEPVVLSIWLDSGTSFGKELGWAAFFGLLGIAMLQGSEVARKVVLGALVLAVGAVSVLLGWLVQVGFGHLWPIMGASLCALVGIFALVVRRDPPLPQVGAAVSLVAAGWIGSVLSTILLVGAPDLRTIRMIREWSAPTRSHDDQAAGISMRVPPGWIVLKAGNPLKGQDRALLTLANTKVMAFAFLVRDPQPDWLLNVDQFLDGRTEAQRTDHGDAKSLDRVGGAIGAMATRRQRWSWNGEGADFNSFESAWKDADTFYYLSLIGPAVVSKNLAEELTSLERSMSFSAPWTTFLASRAEELKSYCPLLSEKSIVVIARIFPRDSAPELYFREGYRLAFRGMPLLDPTASERLRGLMKAMFDAIPRGQIDRFGGYVERLRAGGQTSPADDQAMAAVVRAAVEKLSPGDQQALRDYFAMAISMGHFGLKQGTNG
jgi:hypothetical protein